MGCNQSKDDVIKIGAILPLTGDAAAWGIPPKNAALLAVEQINADGGINGKKLELIVEDGGCDPKMGVSAINKLLSVDKPIAVVGAVCSAVTLAIA
ncbi:Leu/Ile/Val-binding protein like protein, partial [Aduncisulcus paluster]